jgi:hypothetical protein
MSNEKFAKTLDSLMNKLSVLKKKYVNNSTITQMVNYLESGLKELYQENDIDRFFCELTDTCNQNIDSKS